MIREAFSVEDSADVDVSAPSGSVFVEGGPRGEISVEIDTKREDEWRVARSGSSVRVHHERGNWLGGGRADVRIHLPAGTDLRVGTASAEVRSSVDLGRVSVSTASGNVFLASARDVSATTASGDIRLEDVEADLSVKSASGDVLVASVGGNATIKTASGDTHVRSVRGAVTVSSASGDIRVDDYRGLDLELTTMSGDITFGLPAGTSVRLQASTMSGRVDLPDRRPSTTAADGDPVSAKAKSVSGDIRIVRRRS